MSQPIERIRARLAGAEEGWLFAQVAGQVADRRKERGLSQAELAARVGTTQSAIARLESGGRPPRSDTRLSKAEFQSQANAICAKYQKQLNAIDEPTSLDEIPDLVDQALVILNKEIDEVAALNPPEELQGDFDRMIAASNK